MTTKNFNAKKMLMSTLAAVVLSFVFTTSADANTHLGEASQRVEAHKCYIEAHKCHKCSIEEKQEQKKENTSFISQLLKTIFGVRV